MKEWISVPFKLRDSVFLEKICDEYVLIAVKDAANHCHHLQSINDVAAYYWEKLEEERFDLKKIIDQTSQKFQIDPDIIQDDLYLFLEMLDQGDYLVYLN